MNPALVKESGGVSSKLKDPGPTSPIVVRTGVVQLPSQMRGLTGMWYVDFGDMPPSAFIRHMGDQFDRPQTFLMDVVQSNTTGSAHGELREPPQCISRAVGVYGRDRAAMAGIECVKKDARLRAANLAQNDTVWSMAQCRFQQVTESDLALVCIELDLGRDNVRLPYVEFSHVFKDEDSIAVRNRASDDIGECCLTDSGPARDKEVVPTENGFG